ncbi:hypothetical protein COCVIDRAFT_112103 [Bipolaris victoriae FI3]|uniref:Ubiquitin 3 binding protein But2 C-terminal domain-containing protein n=1 Tax=Bipolaris victoriae (strain FI3) TaxID=930091 RepID=W7E4S2_BIPV3|nr:hypothetical protein COCVIDRAFT_112103 [Bipolaris victoriae FI3]
MLFFKPKSIPPDYTAVAQYKDDFEDRSSSEPQDSIQLLEKENNNSSQTPPNPSKLPLVVIYFSLALALLSAVNIALLPATLSQYLAYPLTDAEIKALPYGDERIGLDRVAQITRPLQVYDKTWPDRIARVSRKLKYAVWGQGVQIYITVEDSTVMRFPIPSHGTDMCALFWKPPPESSARIKDLTTKGEITEIEVWKLIATSASGYSDIDDINYDTLSYSTLPVRGELLGVLDLTARPNSTTVEFACPREAENLVVEMRCQRVACHVDFLQVEMVPRFGFELLRRQK